MLVLKVKKQNITSIAAFDGTSANGTTLLRISFWRSFCFSAFFRWPVFFFGIFWLAFQRTIYFYAKNNLALRFTNSLSRNIIAVVHVYVW